MVAQNHSLQSEWGRHRFAVSSMMKKWCYLKKNSASLKLLGVYNLESKRFLLSHKVLGTRKLTAWGLQMFGLQTFSSSGTNMSGRYAARWGQMAETGLWNKCGQTAPYGLGLHRKWRDIKFAFQ